MLNTGMIERDPIEALDLHFRQCSITISCRDLAMMAVDARQ
jgi:glutaminase